MLTVESLESASVSFRNPWRAFASLTVIERDAVGLLYLSVSALVEMVKVLEPARLDVKLRLTSKVNRRVAFVLLMLMLVFSPYVTCAEFIQL